MKFLYFIKWCWNKIVAETKSFDRWMWAWVVTCAWGPQAFMNREADPTSYNLFVMFVFIFWGLYGFVYTGIKRLYKKFQEEQEQMVNHLKDIG